MTVKRTMTPEEQVEWERDVREGVYAGWPGRPNICLRADCDKRIHARGYCRTHYQQWRRTWQKETRFVVRVEPSR